MSFAIATEWVQSASEELSGIRNTILQVSESIAGHTTDIAPAAADEISAAIADLFGGIGREYQVLSAQTGAYHARFVEALNSSVGAYLSAEAANVGLAAATALPAASILDSLGGLLPGLPSLNALLPGVVGPAPGPTPVSLTAITGPYESFFTNTIANLQSLGNGIAANPFPFLRQFIANQVSYGGIVTSAFSHGDLAMLASIPARFGQNFVNVFSTLTDFSFSVGTNINPFAAVNPLTHLSQNITNLQLGAAFFGLPIALGIDLIGSPINTGSAIISVVSALANAVQNGDGFGALVAVLTAPAVVANGFVNGEILINVGLPGVTLPLVGGVGGITVPLTGGIPLGGILTPLSTTTLYVNPLGSPQSLLSVPLGGTPTNGIVPGLLLYAPQQLATAIGAPPAYAPLIPVPVITLPGIGTLPSLAGVVAGLGGVLGGLGGLTGGLSSLGSLLGGLVPGLNGGVPGLLGGVLGGGGLLGGTGGLLGGGGGLLGL